MRKVNVKSSNVSRYDALAGNVFCQVGVFKCAAAILKLGSTTEHTEVLTISSGSIWGLSKLYGLFIRNPGNLKLILLWTRGMQTCKSKQKCRFHTSVV